MKDRVQLRHCHLCTLPITFQCNTTVRKWTMHKRKGTLFGEATNTLFERNNRGMFGDNRKQTVVDIVPYDMSGNGPD